ncbi:unnamed protein product [Caenorhabditis bovis]|uniref:Uncharacterized protein n=1 Tax=Caenorhabditis bovis TaxID=2654633 RepID=A0A8S1E8Y1_9PELO|nr:unnamed protein product [Caenorhabditis bovis]
MLKVLVLALTTTLVESCFCPSLFTSSCGCGGYSGGYGAGYSGGYASSGYPTTGNNGYAVFYRDLTPFRQPQYYPQQQPQVLPQMYQLPNPRFLRPAPRPYVSQTAQVQPQRPPPTLITQSNVYQQPPAPVSALSQEVRVTHAPVLHEGEISEAEDYNNEEPGQEQVNLSTEEVTTTQEPFTHDNFITPAAEQSIVDVQPATQATFFTEQATDAVTDATVFIASTQAPVVTTTSDVDFAHEVDDKQAKSGSEKKGDEFYYVYYDDHGNKVGDSRSGSTFAPEEVVSESTTVQPVAATVMSTLATYDDVVEETVTTSTPAVTVSRQEPEIIEASHKGEDVIYEDDGDYEEETEGTKTNAVDDKSPNSKRGLGDNQILVTAAEEMPYRRIAAARGIKTIKRRIEISPRLIHSN